MKKATSNILSVDISDDVIQTNPLEFMMVLIYPQTRGNIDKPRITVSLNKIENYDDYEGEDLLSKFRTSAVESRFKAEESSFETLSKNDCTMHVVHSFTKSTFQNVEYDFVYFDALILINDLYCIEFLVNIEKADEEDFTPIYTSVLESLQWSGNAEDCAKYFEEIDKKVTEIENRYGDTIDEEYPEWDRPIADFQIPLDGKEVFEIGGINFDMNQEQSSVESTTMSKELHVNLVAQTSEYKKGEEILLLDINEYSEAQDKGLVKISFPVEGIYQNGIPTGSFNFKDGKCETPYLSITDSGFEFTLKFCGTVSFEKGWIGLNGYMKASYNDNPVFDVKIYKQFDPVKLNWCNYSFKSLEEALQANPNEVEWLEIKNPTFEALPESIFEFKNLKSLWITDTTWNSKLNLNFISNRIGELIHLESLHISRTNIAEIPLNIGDLTKLTSLFFADSSIKKIPNAVLNLPNIQYLNFDDNLIEEISEPINLPSLFSLSISGNLLKTLPESIVLQPKINSINLENNPLEFLPNAFNDFHGIKLTIGDKIRLLDYEYKGANKNGTISWDNTIYYCKKNDTLFKDFAAIINTSKLQKHEGALLALTKKSIGFSHIIEEDYREVANHRFGGKPDLPLSIPYPTFIYNYEGETEYKYEFIGQVNCETIADLQSYLPRKGTLFFFLETLHNIYGGIINPCKIIYVEDNNTLVSGQRFEFNEADYYEMFELYESFKVMAEEQLSVPAFYSIFTNSYLMDETTKSLENIEEFQDVLFEKFEEPIHDKFPHAYAINAYGFTQHESPELQASLQLKGNPEDWTILLKVTSSGDMQWGDAGDLFFVIHKSDLAKCDFSNVFVTMESS